MTAKIQVLHLPDQDIGEITHTPFALIVSGYDTDADSEGEAAAWEKFKDGCRASAILVTEQQIEVG